MTDATAKPVNKRVADYLRQKLVARSGAESAAAKIAANMSDEQLIAKFHNHTALEVAKLETKS
jgi:hypothetical protein